MYAIIRTGGKQAKVREGDVIDVEHLRVQGEVSFTPLLVVDDAGTVFSHRDVLKDARVVARIVGEAAGPKVDLFKYKSKTGYRRHQGHRQRYTTLEVTRIDAPAGAAREAAKPKPAKAAPVAEVAEATAEAAPKPAAEKPAAPKAATPKAAPKPAAKKPAAPKPATSKAAPKPAAKKPAAPKPAAPKAAPKPAAKKPAAPKKES